MRPVIIEIDEQELWSSVFGSAFESWGPWWYEVEYLDGADWDKIGKVSLAIQDEDTGKITKKIVDLDDVLKALPVANSQVNMDLFDFDKYDAVCGDAILQVCLFGEVIYG